MTVTLMDGLVLARSTFHHSMNYRLRTNPTILTAYFCCYPVAQMVPVHRDRAMRTVNANLLNSEPSV